MTGNYFVGTRRMENGNLPGFEAWEIRKILEKYGAIRESLSASTGLYPKDIQNLRAKVGRYTNEEKEMLKEKLGEKPLPFMNFVFG